MHYLVAQLKDKQVPILLLIRHEYEKSALLSLLYLPVEDKYQLCQQATDLKQPCLIVYGLTRLSLDSELYRKNYESTYKLNSLENILMACMAVHPQYSGKKLRALQFNPYTPLLACVRPEVTCQARSIESAYFQHKSLAVDLGCLANDARLLNIRHIAAGTTRDSEYYCAYSPLQLTEYCRESCH